MNYCNLPGCLRSCHSEFGNDGNDVGRSGKQLRSSALHFTQGSVQQNSTNAFPKPWFQMWSILVLSTLCRFAALTATSLIDYPQYLSISYQRCFIAINQWYLQTLVTVFPIYIYVCVCVHLQVSVTARVCKVGNDYVLFLPIFLLCFEICRVFFSISKSACFLVPRIKKNKKKST